MSGTHGHFYTAEFPLNCNKHTVPLEDLLGTHRDIFAIILALVIFFRGIAYVEIHVMLLDISVERNQIIHS